MGEAVRLAFAREVEGFAARVLSGMDGGAIDGLLASLTSTADSKSPEESTPRVDSLWCLHPITATGPLHPLTPPLYNALWCVLGPFGGHFRLKTPENRQEVTPKGSRTHQSVL